MARSQEEPIRVALIGYGMAGSVFHAPLIGSTPGLKLASIVTGNRERQADAIKQHPGVRILDDVGALWNSAADHDLAVVATPNRTHVMTRLLDRYKVQNAEHLFEYSCAEFVAAVERAGARVTHVEGLLLALPVYVPFKGWRDVFFGIRRRWGLPGPLNRLSVRAGRWFPRQAENLAIVAVRS